MERLQEPPSQSRARARCTRPRVLGLWLLLALFPALSSEADDAGLPVAIQAALLKKILNYDRSIANVAEVKVLVVAADGTVGTDIVSAFEAIGMHAQAVKPAAVSSQLTKNEVIFVSSSSISPEVRKACSDMAVLSVANEPELVRRGEASIALAKKDNGRPEILVNLSRLKVEGHDLAASLLGMATVIR